MARQSFVTALRKSKEETSQNPVLFAAPCAARIWRGRSKLAFGSDNARLDPPAIVLLSPTTRQRWISPLFVKSRKAVSWFVWAEKLVSVEVDHVLGCIGDPDLCFPRRCRGRIFDRLLCLGRRSPRWCLRCSLKRREASPPPSSATRYKAEWPWLCEPRRCPAPPSRACPHAL